MVRHLHPVYHHIARIRKLDRSFGNELDFEVIKFPVESKNIPKTGKMYSISISVFGYEHKKKYLIYISKSCFKEKHVIIDRRRRQKTYVLIKNFNTFMYDHTLHCGRTHFCCYHLQAFTNEEIIKCHVKDCFKINGKQMIKMP